MRVKGYRTVALNGLIAIAAVATQIAEVPGLEHLIGENSAAKFIAVVAVANIVLRFATTTPIGRRD